MLWPLVSPIFLGTFLALVAVILLMGKAHKLTRGPRRAFNRMMYGCGCGCGKPDCACSTCRAYGGKKKGTYGDRRRWGRQVRHPVRLAESQRPPPFVVPA